MLSVSSRWGRAHRAKGNRIDIPADTLQEGCGCSGMTVVSESTASRPAEHPSAQAPCCVLDASSEGSAVVGREEPIVVRVRVS